MMTYKHLFGPVLSRRLGISLGVDLIPEKYCTMDCVYCEIGKTSNLLTKRDEYIAPDNIIEELNHYLETSPKLDYITFSGAGEPTLNKGMGVIIDYLKTNYPQYQLALITNSSLLNDPEVRAEINRIDLIMPSLDAIRERTFKKINRPEASLKIDDIVSGLIAFRAESRAEMWLEVFFIPKINDSYEEITLLKEAIIKINPDRVQINSLDRPGTEKWVDKEPQKVLEEIAEYFKPLPVEIIARKKDKAQVIDSQKKGCLLPEKEILLDRILTTLKRRPCTAEELATIFGQNLEEMTLLLNELVKVGQIIEEERESGIFLKRRY